MKVFISWSGEESLAVAQVLRDQLPCVINAVRPFVSSEDISKGTLWFQKVATELENSDFGIICITQANQKNPWVLFEAGALAGKFSRSKVAPLLVDLEPSAVGNPLSQFQFTSLSEKKDFLKLLKSINAELKDKALADAVLERSFENWWSGFSEQIKQAKAKAPRPAKPTERSDRKVLNEVLSLTRSMAAENSPRSYTASPTIEDPFKNLMYPSQQLKPKTAGDTIAEFLATYLDSQKVMKQQALPKK
jgi:hypothetical protein